MSSHPHPRPVLVSSWNGAPATKLAVELHAQGLPLLAGMVRGIGLVEDDPEEMSVGFGGLPNEDGEAELDAAVMDGVRHKAGGVAGLRRVRHACAVAYEVLQRTDHALLVGEGALKFARQLGFLEEDLATAKSREAWLLWKAGLSAKDAWLSVEERSEFGRARSAGQIEEEMRKRTAVSPTAVPSKAPTAPFTYGTIHVSGLDGSGDLFAATSTSGLSYKIPGRVGDSPIVGAGLYVENDVGAAGATGRGEATFHSCAAFDAVREMERGASPTEACLAALRRIVKHTKEPRLLNELGRPTFNVTMYALRKDGEVGAASMHEGYQYVVQRGGETRVERTAFLFGK
jgi:N4-(beta-N-acetylglucosaminyl)-L-asparaginase